MEFGISPEGVALRHFGVAGVVVRQQQYLVVVEFVVVVVAAELVVSMMLRWQQSKQEFPKIKNIIYI